MLSSLVQGLPFPIAFSYHLIRSARDWATRFQRVLWCYETTVRYLAAVQLSDYLSAGCPNHDLNQTIVARLNRELTVGHWVEIVREVTRLQHQGVFEPFMPELLEFYFKGGRAKLTPAAQILDSQLLSARNRWAHAHSPASEDASKQRFQENSVLLERLLEALGFLVDYTLYVPLRRAGRETVKEALRLMGPHDQPETEFDLDLRLSPKLSDAVQDEISAFLVWQRDPARQLLLCPLSLFACQDAGEDVFLLDRCEFRHRVIHRLLYRAVRLNQNPLEILPGSHYDELVQQFHAAIELMLGTAASVESPNRPSESPDLAASYFTVQREVIQEHSARFVGRDNVLDAADRFMKDQPRGYFVIRAGPGQGKTALASKLVKANQWVHHFVSRTGGRAELRLILRSLVAQLAEGLPRLSELPETVPELTKLFGDLLARQTAEGRKVVVLIDALDELPADCPDDLPFLILDGLPEGAYFVVTGRPGDRLDWLVDSFYAVPHQKHDLGPLQIREVAAVLRVRRPSLSDAEVHRIAEASHGNPLYLQAVAHELEKNPGFSPEDLPHGIEGFFRRSTGHLRSTAHSSLENVLGLLAAARKPLQLREMGQITGARQREIHQQGIRPVRQFLSDSGGGYAFYHERFHEFVVRELLYEDELVDYHAKLAEWLRQPQSAAYDYRYSSLVHHLFHAGDFQGVEKTVDLPFLREKVKRFGYSVLEDVELLVRKTLATGDLEGVPRCVELVESLRKDAGDEFLDETRRAIQLGGASPKGPTSRITPRVKSIPAIDVYVGLHPKSFVGADLFTVLPCGQRLLAAVGDAPGGGIKGAFIARFVKSALEQLVRQRESDDLEDLLGQLNRMISIHPYFENVSLCCAEIDPQADIVRIASAGHPYPVQYIRRLEQCRRLPVRGDQLHSAFREDPTAACFEQRRAEFHPGEILAIFSDGLVEHHKIWAESYGYRFTQIVERMADRSAAEIGEAVLDDWLAYSGDDEYHDDVTMMIIKRAALP